MSTFAIASLLDAIQRAEHDAKRCMHAVNSMADTTTRYAEAIRFVGAAHFAAAEAYRHELTVWCTLHPDEAAGGK